ncbi:MAG: RNA-binding protein [Cycloclasticus sp. symbiont of Poecilosclerida sp. M]|nr:MAG: RNA-binding protein [Cycloclasticus sp. symbiont of Poecilosclerida sp. M]
MTPKRDNKPEKTLDKLRLDKWLWAARFYKTRRLAAEAITGGKVHVNQHRVKPSKEIQIDDSLRISKNTYHWEVFIRGLNEKRRPACEACLLFEETAESLRQRQELIATNKAFNSGQPRPERPNKKQRRQIHRFKRAN